ncbi:hypothetical protein D7S86_19750 [Pararobbsia silviterrae]|uniref:Flagellar FliJ protein n=1 Tax=Pararobbsia silviterrae TaxID=1792498 RepID=A0A494XI73_9BURK|nr:hypothetical protein D7S86_19750 [Pararobbsia silviterrae]
MARLAQVIERVESRAQGLCATVRAARARERAGEMERARLLDDAQRCRERLDSVYRARGVVDRTRLFDVLHEAARLRLVWRETLARATSLDADILRAQAEAEDHAARFASARRRIDGLERRLRATRRSVTNRALRREHDEIEDHAWKRVLK